MKNFLKILLILFISTIVGFLLLLIAYALPAGRIEKNLEKSLTIFENEETYERDIYNYDNTQLDNFTDAIMLENASYIGDQSIVDKAINVYKYNNHSDPRESLILQLKNKEHKTLSPYSRYWHGYLVLLKPFLLFFSYNDFRYINIIAGSLLVAFIIYMMQKKKLDSYILPYLISILLINPSTIFRSLQYSTIFYLFNISVLLLLLFDDKLKKRYIYYFLFVGILTSYFDFLTYPAATLGMPLILCIILNSDLKWLEKIKMIIKNSFFWGVGYAGMWICKFILGTCLFGTEILKSSMNQIKIRTSFETQYESITIKEIFKRNILKYNTKISLIIFALFLAYIIYKIIKYKIKFNKKMLLDLLPYLLICLIPFAWYVALSNHSYIHNSFTYRTLIITIFAGLSGIIYILEKNRRSKNERKK